MKVINIAGARPNFMKIAPLIKEMRRHPEIEAILMNTGQHYDANMAGRFFEDLEIPPPDVSLEVGSGSHAAQTAEVMKRSEPVFERERPDVVLVVGDVNSTVAAALTAAKMKIKVAHVEAGLRSFDREMPEEINRLVTDVISDFHFVTEESARKHLLAEGVDPRKVFFVGNVMIDSLESSRHLWANSKILDRLQLAKGRYGVVTLHRPSNVDHRPTLTRLLEALVKVAESCPLIFPIHPRTVNAVKSMDQFRSSLHFDGAPAGSSGILCIEPLGYLDFIALVANSRIVLTDSGGLQEETTVLGVPCLTLRENTERPVTITHGTNRVIGASPERIFSEAELVFAGNAKLPVRPPLWDGRAAERIVKILLEQVHNPAGTRRELVGTTK